MIGAAFYGSLFARRFSPARGGGGPGAVGVGDGAVFHRESYRDDYLRARSTSRRCHRRDLRCLRTRHNDRHLFSTLLLTAAFRYYTGDAAATPTAANPAMFVRSMNFSFMIGGFMALAAMLCSGLRGQAAK